MIHLIQQDHELKNSSYPAAQIPFFTHNNENQLISFILFFLFVSSCTTQCVHKQRLPNTINNNITKFYSSNLFFFSSDHLLSTPKPMATSLKTPIIPASALLQSKQTTTLKEELTMKYYSDDLVTGYIYAKHRDDDSTRIDLPRYISVIENILTLSDRITDAVLRVLRFIKLYSVNSKLLSIYDEYQQGQLQIYQSEDFKQQQIIQHATQMNKQIQ